jgi:hypothetical protein
MHWFFLFFATLMVTACSGVEPKLEPVRPVEDAVTTTPVPDPKPTPQTQREKLIAEHGEPFVSDHNGAKKFFAVVRVVYDSNDNGIADPDETTISDTNVFASYASGGGTRINAQGTTNSKGTALFELPTNFYFKFSASNPVTSDHLAAWTLTDDMSETPLLGYYQENAVQQKTLLLACRDASTGQVIPRPAPNATGTWRCANNTFSSIKGSWRTLGAPIETYSYLKHFGVPKNAPEKVTVVLGWYTEEGYSNQGVSFHQLENGIWREAATQFETRWKSFEGQDGATYIRESVWGHPPFVVDSYGRFSVLQPNDNLDATVLKTWRDGAWQTKGTVASEVLSTYQTLNFGVDSSDRPTRTREDSTTGQTLEEFWDGNRWQTSGFTYPTIDINASPVIRTANGKAYHFFRAGFGIEPKPTSKLMTLEAGRWLEKDSEPEFQGVRSKTCNQVWSVKAAYLMMACQQRLETPGASYYALSEIQTVSLLHDHGWQTIYYKGPWTDLQVDPAGNPVMVSLYSGKLFSQRWDGQQWQRLGTAINENVPYLDGGRLTFGQDGRMLVAWFGQDQDRLRKLYVSEFTP